MASLIHSGVWNYDDQMLFFRYTSSTGAFLIGDEPKNRASQVRYFGDELRCGYMRLRQKKARNGGTFSYNETITAPDATALAWRLWHQKIALLSSECTNFRKKISYLPGRIG